MPKQVRSKKKKPTPMGNKQKNDGSTHTTSLIQQIESLADPGKFKPIKGSSTGSGAEKREVRKQDRKLQKELQASEKLSEKRERRGLEAMTDDNEVKQDDVEIEEDEEDFPGLPAAVSQKILSNVAAQQAEMDAAEAGEELDGADVPLEDDEEFPSLATAATISKSKNKQKHENSPYTRNVSLRDEDSEEEDEVLLNPDLDEEIEEIVRRNAVVYLCHRA